MSEERWWAAHAEAKRRLEGVPGIVGVGLGIKERGRALTDRVAVIVYVEAKKPPEDVAPEHLVPATIGGVPTDVQTQPVIEPFGGTTLDGGDQIRRSPDAHDRPKPGTLGYVARKGSEHVLLSCEHVMLHRRRGDLRIFHPDVSTCCGRLKNSVGSVVDGTIGIVPFTNAHGTDVYFVDAATASIDDGVTARKFIPDVGPVSGAGDISANPTGGSSPTITVRKRGAVTGLTEGTVDDVAYPFQQTPRAPVLPRVIKIRPKEGHTFPFTITWKVPAEDVAAHLTDFPGQSLGGTATQLDADTVRFDVPVFAVPGDSGAAVVDVSGGGAGEIVGLVVSGSIYELRAFKDGRLGTGIVPTGFTVACHIQPALDELGLALDPSTTPTAGAAELHAGREMLVATGDQVRAFNERLYRLEAKLDRDPAGRRFTGLLRKHADELMELVHHRRRVMVRWHRNKGPAFAALLVNAVLDPTEPLPTAVDGVSRETLLREMRDVLGAEGSPALRGALEADGEFVLDLLEGCVDLDALVGRLA